MPFIRVNDIFDELFAENQRLLKEIKFSEKLINVLNKYLNEFNLITNQLKTYFNSNQLKCFEELSEEYKEVMKTSEESVRRRSVESNDENEEKVNKNSEKSVIKTNKSIVISNKIRKFFKCPINGCNKLFSEEKSLQKHVKTEHKKTLFSFKCSTIGCNKVFINKDLLQKHMNTDHKEVMTTSEELSREMSGNIIKIEANKDNNDFISNKIIKKVFKCSINGCNELFSEEKSIENHMKTKHKKTLFAFKCSTIGCNKVFINSDLLQKHINTEHKSETIIELEEESDNQSITNETNESIDKSFKCPNIDCNKLFTNEDMLKEHMKCHFSKYSNKRQKENQNIESKDTQCLNSFEDIYLQKRCKQMTAFKTENNLNTGLLPNEDNLKEVQVLKTYSKILTKVFKCSTIGCNKLFSNKDLLQKHINTEHKSETNIESDVYICSEPECDYKTHDLFDFKSHIHTNKHSIEKPFIYAINDCDKSYLKFICNFADCFKSFSTEILLKRHQMRHNPHKRYECSEPNCEYKTNDRRSLELHKMIRHSNCRPFKCTYNGCDKSYATLGLLKNHQKFHIIGEYKCHFDGCNKTFSCEPLLKTHLCIHTNVMLSCDKIGCNYKTKFSFNLKQHKLIHSNKYNYSCDWPACGKRFRSSRGLYVHSRRHTNSETYVCDFPNCSKSYSDKSTFIEHKLTHNPNKRYECPEPNCNFKTHYNRYLKKHKMTKHSNERPFKCTHNGCVKSYATLSNLRVHQMFHNIGEYKCHFNGCNKTFSCEPLLKTHLCIHSNRVLSCDWDGCEYTTNTTYKLNAHKRLVHSNESIACHWPQCEKRFKHKTYLEIHLKSHTKIQSNERNFPCVWPECGKWFKTKQYLESHSRIHRNDKRFVCQWPGCNYRGVQHSALMSHMKKHQKKVT